MIRGIYTSGLGMTRESKRLDIVSNNLANASTTAFKSDGAVCGTFKKALNDVMVSGSRVDIANYTPDIVNTYTNFTQGSLYNTGNATDLAISNDNNAFFTVEDGNGNRMYTRDGAFIIDKDNFLVTAQGYRVLGTEGYINITDPEFAVSVSGQINNNANEILGNLLITSFENPESLNKIGNNMIEASSESVEKEFEGEVQQSFLEMSNVNTVSEMVNMIAISRAYEANQRVLQTQDEMLGRSVSDVGRV
jgi:flagellar basal-body rod protein FlgG